MRLQVSFVVSKTKNDWEHVSELSKSDIVGDDVEVVNVEREETGSDEVLAQESIEVDRWVDHVIIPFS